MATIQEIREQFAPVNDPEEQALRIAKWSIYFLGDKNSNHYWIRESIPQIHIDIYKALSSECKFYYITAPRGFGKSTIVQLVYVLYRIYYRLDPYIALIEKNKTAGHSVLDNIKYEIRDNPKLNQIYGDLQPSRSKKDEDKVWSKSEIRLRNGVFVRSIGMGGNVRGSLDRMYRYTLIIANDVQEVKTMREPSTLEFHQSFWERDVEHAIDHSYGKVRLVGNQLGHGCLINYIKSDYKYDGIDFAALVNDKGEPDLYGKSVWESKFPTKDLHEERDNYKRKGKLFVFNAERMNIVDDSAVQKLDGYRYHDCKLDRIYGQNVLISDMYSQPIPVYTYYLIDPAYANTESADHRAGVTIALGRYPDRDYIGNTIWVNGCWVLDYNYDYSDPSQLINRGLELHVRYRYKGLVIEANGVQQIYEYIGNQNMRENVFVFNNPLNFIPVKKVSGNKIDRIYEALSLKCKLGQFYIRPEHEELAAELDMFTRNPSGLHILDAIAMGLRVCTVCTENVRTFSDEWKDRHRKNSNIPESDWGNPLSIIEAMGL